MLLAPTVRHSIPVGRDSSIVVIGLIPSGWLRCPWLQIRVLPIVELQTRVRAPSWLRTGCSTVHLLT